MSPRFKCIIENSSNAHLSQLYNGFKILKDAGIADVSLKTTYHSHNGPVINMIYNNRYSVAYDVMDGYNWIAGSPKDNLAYFKRISKPDFYFRRSIDNKVRACLPDNCKMFPLGLNYFIKNKKWPKRTIRKTVKDVFKNNRLLSRYLFWNRDNFYARDFEFYPVLHKNNQILFLTRLWDPEQFNDDETKASVEAINTSRMESIKYCRKEFGQFFLGGLHADDFSKKHCKDLLVPSWLTKKENYLKMVIESNVCVATTGLHNSIGWKLGEYVAASRAIVSEPLFYEVPGNFKEPHHYLSFNNSDKLLENISLLMNDKETMREMMAQNYLYYQRYLKPDMMVLNTLTTIEKETEI